MIERDIDIICKGISNWEMYRNTTVLITGSTGRLGRYILETLAEVDSRYNLYLKIVGMARSRKKVADVFSHLVDRPNISFVYQDINNPVEYNGSVDYIFHTAGPAAPRDFKESAASVLWTHVNGTRNVLEFAVGHNTKKVFYVSTVETYGEWQKDSLINEEEMGPLRNKNARACYPEAKRLCETMLFTYKATYGLDFGGVTLCHTLGPGIVLDDGRAFAEFINCVLNERDIILHSDGGAMRTYTYTPDVINAVFLIMEKGENGCLYNVAANENLISIRDLANLIANFSPNHKTTVKFSDEASKMPYLPFKLPIMDTTKIRNLGWAPQTNLRDMFYWTIESFRE